MTTIVVAIPKCDRYRWRRDNSTSPPLPFRSLERGPLTTWTYFTLINGHPRIPFLRCQHLRRPIPSCPCPRRRDDVDAIVNVMCIDLILFGNLTLCHWSHGPNRNFHDGAIKMLIFYSYVSLQEGNFLKYQTWDCSRFSWRAALWHYVTMFPTSSNRTSSKGLHHMEVY